MLVQAYTEKKIHITHTSIIKYRFSNVIFKILILPFIVLLDIVKFNILQFNQFYSLKIELDQMLSRSLFFFNINSLYIICKYYMKIIRNILYIFNAICIYHA